jgi:hypothetical protein
MIVQVMVMLLVQRLQGQIVLVDAILVGLGQIVQFLCVGHRRYTVQQMWLARRVSGFTLMGNALPHAKMGISQM